MLVSLILPETITVLARVWIARRQRRGRAAKMTDRRPKTQ